VDHENAAVTAAFSFVLQMRFYQLCVPDPTVTRHCAAHSDA
jgi:hypothetical protein